MQPKSVAPGTDGALWVADTFSDRVQKLTAAGELRWRATAASGTFGPAPGGGPGEFRNPYGVAVDPASGAVYVADTGNDRVQRFDGTTWSVVAGTTFNAPRGVAVDASGRLLVADTGNDRVLRLSGTTWSAVGSGYARPEAVTTSGSSVYVADTGNSRVLKLDAATGAVAAHGGERRHAPARSASPRVWRWTSGATCSSPTPATTASLRFDAGGAYIDSLRRQRHRRRPAHPARPGHRRRRRRCCVADPFNNRVQRYTLSTLRRSRAPRATSVSRGGSDRHGHACASTPTGGFARPVSLSLSGCPSAATCTLSPSTLTPSGGAYPTATLRVQAGASTPAGQLQRCAIAGRTTSPTMRAHGERGAHRPLSTRPAGFEPATSASGGQRSIH